MDDSAILIAAACVAVGAYFVHKLMSALSELQQSVVDLQNVSALVVQELQKPRVLESDIQPVTAAVANVTDSLRRALPVPLPS